jgi:hypothetical protein
MPQSQEEYYQNLARHDRCLIAGDNLDDEDRILYADPFEFATPVGWYFIFPVETDHLSEGIGDFLPTLSESQMCDGHECFYNAGNQLAQWCRCAISPECDENLRNFIITHILPNQYNLHPGAESSQECGLISLQYRMDVIHYIHPNDTGGDYYHALTIGPCLVDSMDFLDRNTGINSSIRSIRWHQCPLEIQSIYTVVRKLGITCKKKARMVKNKPQLNQK